MKLSKENIQQIDNHLKNGGIKYWDVRLEMIDHIASEMENNKNEIDFDTAFKQSLKTLNWDKDLDVINTQSWKTTNKIYRAKHFKEMLAILKKPIYLLGFILFYVGFSWVLTSCPKLIKPISIIPLSIPIIVFLFEIMRTLPKKLGRSVNMDYGWSCFTFGIFIIWTPLQLLPKTHITIWLPIIMILYLLMTLSGYRVYKYALNKVLIMKSLN